jgi:hypothetical protein
MVEPTCNLHTKTSSSAAAAAADAAAAIDRLKRDKLCAYLEIERYKKIVTYAVILAVFAFAVAVVCVAWRFTEDAPTFEQLRERVIRKGGREKQVQIGGGEQ